MRWIQEQRQRARFEVAKTKHEAIVQRAAGKGLPVPAKILSYYGLHANGEREPTIFGTPLSQAMKIAREAIDAARKKSLPDFREWMRAHPQDAARLAFFPGILGDGGDLFWKLIQKAFSPPELPPLFEQLKDGDASKQRE